MHMHVAKSLGLTTKDPQALMIEGRTQSSNDFSSMSPFEM